MTPIELWKGSRREFLNAALVAASALCIPLRARSGDAKELPEATRTALAKSPLIYISPLRADGSESSCHAEVWFVRDGGELLVVTTRERWRARALRRDLDRARIWVGDFGVWKKSRRFQEGPTFLARGSFETDRKVIERALQAFGGKYTSQWSKWGPRFRKGLADGSRVLLRYRPIGS